MKIFIKQSLNEQSWKDEYWSAYKPFQEEKLNYVVS